MCRAWFSVFVAVVAGVCAARADEAKPALQPWVLNHWYWSYEGKPVLLLGGSDDDNLFQWLEKDLVAQLDRLAVAGGNVIRNTMSDRKDKGFEIYPFRQRDDGKYDLNQLFGVSYLSPLATVRNPSEEKTRSVP